MESQGKRRHVGAIDRTPAAIASVNRDEAADDASRDKAREHASGIADGDERGGGDAFI